MRKPVLNWNRLSVPKKMIKAEYIVLQMTNNVAVFASPIPALADIMTAITTLRTASVAAEGGGFDNTLAKREAEIVLNNYVTSLQGYVKAVSAGDEIIIRKAGFDVNKEPAPTPAPEIVKGMSGFPSRKRQVIDLNWDSMEYAKAYQVEQLIEAENPEDNYWLKIVVVTKSKFSVEGLESGKRYTFRVAAIGTNDRIGPFSQSISTIAV